MVSGLADQFDSKRRTFLVATPADVCVWDLRRQRLTRGGARKGHVDLRTSAGVDDVKPSDEGGNDR
jgi:hypothetical protein